MKSEGINEMKKRDGTCRIHEVAATLLGEGAAASEEEDAPGPLGASVMTTIGTFAAVAEERFSFSLVSALSWTGVEITCELRFFKSFVCQYHRTRSLTQSMSCGTTPWNFRNGCFQMVRCEGTVSSDVGLVRHEDNVVEIIQKVDDVFDAVCGSILWVYVAFISDEMDTSVAVTKRSIVEENEVMQCVLEGFVITPDFAQRRLCSGVRSEEIELRERGILCFCDRGQF